MLDHQVLLKVDRLLPLACRDTRLEDDFVNNTIKDEFLLNQTLNSMSGYERMMKFIDCFRISNNTLKSKLVDLVIFDPAVKEFVTKLLDNTSTTEQDSIAARACMAWETDDTYAKALACMLFIGLAPIIHSNPGVWYRIKMSCEHGMLMEQRAARHAVNVFCTYSSDSYYKKLFLL